MQFLPNETLSHILEFVADIKDIVNFGAVCKDFRTLVKVEDKRLTRKVFGNPHFRGTSGHSLFRVTPSGVLNGRAVLNHGSEVFAGTFVDGKLHGVFMSYSPKDECVKSGKYDMGRSIGTFETRTYGITLEVAKYAQSGNGLLYLQKGKVLVHRISPGWSNVYQECYMLGVKFCEYTHRARPRCIKTSRFFKESKICTSEHSDCCEKHRNGMPEFLF
ncbi:hypothetical protein [Brazilian marseillevirus]|uniref:hypothetical protein n=1 Tax=Brazilian marseillevirus TaxID=1813599 RepID=UPI00078515C7|nr:hypothetical protein A3303_gp016 [Brazilian marseillevirus]AMQ10524.1 hypothetical protein [Brazilian marseillevirus]